MLPENSSIVKFLCTLGIDWPTSPACWTNEGREEKIQEALEKSPYREREIERDGRMSGGPGRKKADKGENEGAVRINLKRVFQDEGLQGYDPSLGTCTGKVRPSNHVLNQGCPNSVLKGKERWKTSALEDRIWATLF